MIFRNAKSLVQPFHMLMRVQIRVWLMRQRPRMRHLDENFRIPAERNQLLEFARLIYRAVRHVIDDHGQLRKLFEKEADARHALNGRQHGHGNLQVVAPFPEWRHQRAAVG